MDISALDDLDLPWVAPGEAIPIRATDHWAGDGYDPWGRPLAGDLEQQWRQIAHFKYDGQNHFHTSMWWRDIPVEVSTVYLGVDHQYARGPGVPPLVWETMIFTGLDWLDQWCRRYATRTAAQMNHQKIVECLESIGVALHVGGDPA